MLPFKMTVQGIALLTILFVNHLVISEGFKNETNNFESESSITYCKPRKPKCRIIKAGLTAAEKNELVEIHNKFRSRVAMGNETAAGGLPSASDMREMEWDDEIAAKAQEHAESCVFEHDTTECRKTSKFPYVGQNLGKISGYSTLNPDLKKAVTMWYNEVQDISEIDVSSFKPGCKTISHFTQVIWSSSWKLGCGAVKFKKGKKKGISYMLTCNYGPAGNVLHHPIYKKGKTCSSCPKNTRCGKEGLCKASESSDA